VAYILFLYGRFTRVSGYGSCLFFMTPFSPLIVSGARKGRMGRIHIHFEADWCH
jgi:hypothetical protein